jgi:hypothetical protein
MASSVLSSRRAIGDENESFRPGNFGRESFAGVAG